MQRVSPQLVDSAAWQDLECEQTLAGYKELVPNQGFHQGAHSVNGEVLAGHAEPVPK